MQGHYVCSPSKAVAPRQQLLLFLPGTAPNYYMQIVETASSVGYHAVGLQWDDAPDMAVLCSNDQNATGQNARSVECSRRGMLMRLFGESIAPPNDVGYKEDSPNSIIGRLTALLAFLGRNSSSRRTDVASGSWSQFLGANGSSVEWPKVAVGGHSRGSDYPVLLSKMYPIARGLCFGGPGQEFLGTCNGLQPPSETNCNPRAGFGEAAWLSEKSQIPAADLYGLVAGYTGDACNQGLPAWRILELPGASAFNSTTVSPAALPELASVLGGARQLFDTELCKHATSPHMCMISSVDAPLDEHGRSRLIPVWRYMLVNARPPSVAAIAFESRANCTMAV